VRAFGTPIAKPDFIVEVQFTDNGPDKCVDDSRNTKSTTRVLRYIVLKDSPFANLQNAVPSLRRRHQDQK
jgi:hypothetical protein